MWIHTSSFALAFAVTLLISASQSQAQTETSTPTPLAASATTDVPALIPYSGMALGSDGKAITGEKAVAFLIYKGEQGGEPLFAETQSVTPDPSGQYKVQLGASLSNGIPIDLFASGEARWLEVQIAGEQPQPRVLLVSVPYALKAADAATLGGLPASAYALAGSKTAANTVAPAITPDGVTTVTTTGGVSGHVAEFSGASAIADSPLFVLGADVGIGTTTPTSTLDVNGTALISGILRANGGETVGGTLELAPTGTATAGAGFNSQILKLYSSAYNSASNAVVNPRFGWQVKPSGNDSVAPSGTLNLLFSTTSAPPAPTGFFFNANGTINFAPGQTFPGTGKITSVGLSAPSSDFKVTGSPVTGAGTLGLNWTVAPTHADAANTIVKRDATGSFVAGAITANLGMAGITSVAAGNGVAGIHNGGGIAVLGESLQGSGVGVYGGGVTTGVEGVTTAGNGIYGQGDVGVWGQSTGTNGGSDGVHGVTSSGGASGVAGVNNAGGIGVYGTGGTGVFGTGTNDGFLTDSNVQQARAAGGWVKAMVDVAGPGGAPYSIVLCFNSSLTGAAATTPPCGISLTERSVGVIDLTFNFEVDDRFYSTQILDEDASALAVFRIVPNGLETHTFDSAGNLTGGEYQLIVY
jgi:hypothetical protein